MIKTSWKRVQAFGFSEYGNPDVGLRATNLLQDYEISEKNLVAHVDAKTKTLDRISMIMKNDIAPSADEHSKNDMERKLKTQENMAQLTQAIK